MSGDANLRAWRRARELRDPTLLVEAALARPQLFKPVVEALGHCAPDAAAARIVIDAHDRGDAPSWLAACLLAHVRHPDGYAKELEILKRGDGSLSESYAAHGVVAIAGAAAAHDLENVIDTNDGETAKAAARALASIATPSAVAFLAGTPARGRLRARTVARVLAPAQVPIDAMLRALRSDDAETRRWPAMLIAERLRSQSEGVSEELRRCGASLELREALRVVLCDPAELVWGGDASALRAWLGSL